MPCPPHSCPAPPPVTSAPPHPFRLPPSRRRVLAPPPVFWSRPPVSRPRPSDARLSPAPSPSRPPISGSPAAPGPRPGSLPEAQWSADGRSRDAAAARGPAGGLRNPWPSPLRGKKGCLPCGASVLCRPKFDGAAAALRSLRAGSLGSIPPPWGCT